jgi:hypothetical protein
VNCSINSSSKRAQIAVSGVSNLFSLIVLLSDDLTNEEDDDKGKAGKADNAGGECERCGTGTGACDPTGSNGNTGLGACIDGWTERDAWVDMGLEDLL